MRGVLAAAALAAIAAAGMGSTVTVQADGAREARTSPAAKQDRQNGPGAPLSQMERIAARMRGGGWVGGPGGYRKRPRGSHKQNRRKALAARGRR